MNGVFINKRGIFMKFIKKEKIAAIVAGLFIVCSMMTTFAHPGRTDKNGGHKDNKNVEGNYHMVAKHLRVHSKDYFVKKEG